MLSEFCALQSNVLRGRGHEVAELTADEAQRAYTRLRDSSNFKTALRMAIRDGLRHRRDRSELRTTPEVEGFVADTYGVFLAGDDGDRRLWQLPRSSTRTSGASRSRVAG